MSKKCKISYPQYFLFSCLSECLIKKKKTLNIHVNIVTQAQFLFVLWHIVCILYNKIANVRCKFEKRGSTIDKYVHNTLIGILLLSIRVKTNKLSKYILQVITVSILLCAQHGYLYKKIDLHYTYYLVFNLINL